MIGAAKCGTSTLCALLGEHPDVFMSDPKEPNFFSYDSRYFRGLDTYETLFEGAEGCTAVGEGTTAYSLRLVFPEVATRVAKDLPDVRLIYIVRNPFERMQSEWIEMLSRAHRMPFNFFGALKTHTDKIVESCNYLAEIDIYREHYPDDRILVLFFEDLKADPAALMARCYEFLGVSPTFVPADIHLRRNVSKGKTVEGPVLKRLRMTPGFDFLSRLAPSTIKESIRARTLVKAPPRPEWTREMIDWVLERIGDDTKKFLERYGKPADLWPVPTPSDHA